MNSIGIDIGNHSIKVVEISGDPKSFEIVNTDFFPINKSEDNDPEIAILQALQEITEKYDVTNSRVVTCVPQQFTSMRQLEFPFTERSKILKSLPFEMEEDMPVSLDDCVYDGKVVGKDGAFTNVIGVASTYSEVSQIINLYKKAGIDPDVIGSEIFSINNLIPTAQNIDDIQMRLLIGHERSIAAFYQNGKLIFSRALWWGGNSIASAIAQDFQVPQLEALAMMPTKAFLMLTPAGANADQIRMSDAVAKSLIPLIKELKFTLIEFESSNHGLKPTSVNLLGPINNIPNIGPHLTQKIELPVNPELLLEKIDDYHFRQSKEYFIVALGSAVEGLRRSKSPAINFRKGELKKKNQGFEKTWKKWGYSLQLLAATYVIFFVYGVLRDGIAYNLSERSNENLIEHASTVANLKGKSASPSKIRKYISEQNKKVKAAKAFANLKDIVSPADVLNELSAKLPANNKKPSYDITKFEVKGNQLNIDGHASNKAIIAKIKSILSDFSKNNKVTNNPSNKKAQAGNIHFSYSLKIKRKG